MPMNVDDTLAEQVNALRSAREAIDRALAALGVEDVPAPAVPTSPEAWLPLKSAAGELGMHVATLKRHAKAFRFGQRVPGSNWRIEMGRARAWQAKRPFLPL